MHEIFYFKQKTAYEMRISDWSSDVCSSDLLAQYVERAIGAAAAIGADPLAHVVAGDLDHSALDIAQRCNAGRRYRFSFAETAPKGNPHEGNHPERRQRLAAAAADRSEEHTSELQSLMRNSYAVFCLNKKNNTKKLTHIRTTHHNPC